MARLFAYKGNELIYSGQSHGHVFKPAKLPENDRGSFVIYKSLPNLKFGRLLYFYRLFTFRRQFLCFGFDLCDHRLIFGVKLSFFIENTDDQIRDNRQQYTGKTYKSRVRATAAK